MRKPPKKVLEPLYQRWLEGESLRSICLNTSYSFQSLHDWFKKDFGDQATHFTANSFSRSLLEDYKDNPQIVEWVKANSANLRGGDTLYLSKATLNQHSRKNSFESGFIGKVIELRKSEEDELEVDNRWEFLRLPLLEKCLDVLWVLLLSLMFYEGLNPENL